MNFNQTANKSPYSLFLAISVSNCGSESTQNVMKKVLLIGLFLAFLMPEAMAQRKVSGTVKEAGEDAPLPGVNIIVKGTSTGTTSDINGAYSLEVPGDNATLLFSFIGYRTQEVSVGSRSVIDVALEQDITQLGEVVVTALGIEREQKSLGYAVSEVEGEELTQAKEVNFVNSLSGKVPGLQISQTNGGPGSSTRVVIRGNTSLLGDNQALFVVDGVPVINNGEGEGADFSGNKDYGSPIQDINPEDIESVSVLRGPNAAALYGSRGANGVILITTKRGTRRDGIGVTLNSNLTFETPLINPEFQNEYGQGRYDGALGEAVHDIDAVGSWGPAIDPSRQVTRFDGNGTVPYAAAGDDFENFFRTGITATNSVTISGGSDKATFRLGYTNLENNGINPGSDFKRNAFNLRVSSNLTDKLYVDGKVTYTKTDAVNRLEFGESRFNPMQGLLLKPRSISADDAEKYAASPIAGLPGAFESNNWGYGVNPFYLADRELNLDTRDHYLGLLTMKYAFTDWLELQLRASQDHSVFDVQDISPIGANPQAPDGTMTTQTSQQTRRTYDAILMINKQLNETISLGANLGVVQNRAFGTRTFIIANDQVAPGLFSVNNFENKVGSTFETDEKVNSVFGSLQLGFNDVFFLEATGRNDWSSTLPLDNNSFFYPSVTASVIVSDLLNLNSNTLSFAKVRAGWAQVGNGTTPYNLFDTFIISQDTYNGEIFLYYGNTDSATPYEGSQYGISLKNPNLKPEQTNSIEFGTELRFLDNRLGLDFTYYNSKTEDQIFNVGISKTTGSETVVVNSGEIQNKGIEIALTGQPIRNDNFRWDVNIAYSSNESEVKSLSPEYGLEDLRLGGDFNNRIQVFASTGRPYGDLWGSTYQRDNNGDIVYGQDGLPVVGEVGVIGNATPDFLAGITNTFSYKNFGLSFLIDIRSGGQLYSLTENDMHNLGVLKATLPGREYYSGGNGIMVPAGATIVDADGNEGGTLNPTVAARGVDPGVYWGRLSQISEAWVYDADYVKLRQLTLSYSLPSSLLQNTFINRMKVGYVARNLAVLHKKTDNIDPESSFTSGNLQGIDSYGLPPTRSHGFQLTVEF